MESHLHLIASAKEDGAGLPSIIRDFKKHSAKEILKWVRYSRVSLGLTELPKDTFRILEKMIAMADFRFPNFDRIVADENICEGQARIEGTRITISAILSYLAGGMTPEQIASEFKPLSVEDVMQAISFASANLQDRFIPLRKAI